MNYEITNPSDKNISVDGYEIDARETRVFDSAAAAYLVSRYHFLQVIPASDLGGMRDIFHLPIIQEHLNSQKSAKLALEESKLCPTCKRPWEPSPKDLTKKASQAIPSTPKAPKAAKKKA